MSNEVAIKQETSNEIVQYNESQLELIKTSYCKGASDEELKLFVAVSKRLGLDIFARQIHAVKRKDNKLGREVMTIQTGIDGYRAVAERTGRYAGSSLPTFEYDERGNLVSASVVVKKFVQGHICDFAAIAYMSEYMPKFNNYMWLDRPKGMLSKCAESLALRKAFPQELSGVYTEEELDKEYAHHEHVENLVKRAVETDYTLQDGQIKIIENTCKIITEGMTKEQKIEWTKKNIGCNWNDLKKKTNEELAELINKLDRPNEKPIETTAKNVTKNNQEPITTADIPW